MHRKIARAQIVGALDMDRLVRRAQFAESKSLYADGLPQRIDFQEALNLVADVYDLSANPADYVFVVARAVTAELSADKPAPNENGDAFPLGELLRFDHRLARRVYKTFDLKPNHINHRAENQKTARGFVLDSSFNRLDPDDQYVECLIAIDAKKDPIYADGIRKGAVDAFSMGCVAEYTVCSICGNKATNRWQFCRDIANHKMKLIGGKLSYERCGGVCFEELSAVDMPADPKALAQEVLSMQAQVAEREKLGDESELLVLKSRLAHLERELADLSAQRQEMTMPKLEKAAQAMPPTPVATPPPVTAKEDEDDRVAPSLDSTLPAPKEDGDLLPFAGQADMPLAFDDEEGPAPKAVSPGEQDLADYKREREIDEQKPMTDDEMGVMSVSARRLTSRYAKRFGDIRVVATRAGNFRVYDERSGKSLFAVRPPGRLANRKQALQFCEVILRHIAHRGIDGTIKLFGGIPFPKTSQVLDHADDNFTDDREKQVPVLDDPADDKAEALAKPKTETTEDLDTDKQDEYGAGPATTIDDRVTNMEDAAAAGDLSSTSDPDSDKKDEYAAPGKDSLGEESHDHDERVAKVVAFYQRKVAAQQKAFEEKEAQLDGRINKLADQKAKSMMQRFERCLHLASERQRLNREESVLKIAMADALLTPFDINDHEQFPGCETHLTALLVERGMQEGMPAHVKQIVARARELYTMDDRVLADSERDLKRAVTAPVVAPARTGVPRSARAARVEEQAIDGNPVFRTASEPDAPVEDEKRTAIRASVGRPGFVRGYEDARALGPLGRSGRD